MKEESGRQGTKTLRTSVAGNARGICTSQESKERSGNCSRGGEKPGPSQSDKPLKDRASQSCPLDFHKL